MKYSYNAEYDKKLMINEEGESYSLIYKGWTVLDKILMTVNRYSSLKHYPNVLTMLSIYLISSELNYAIFQKYSAKYWDIVAINWATYYLIPLRSDNRVNILKWSFIGTVF